jgi:hypothetical protein
MYKTGYWVMLLVCTFGQQTCKVAQPVEVCRASVHQYSNQKLRLRIPGHMGLSQTLTVFGGSHCSLSSLDRVAQNTNSNDML